jgi:hypothetical protein
VIWDRALPASQIRALTAGVSPLALTSFGPFIATDLGSLLLGKGATAYVRIPFDAPDLTARTRCRSPCSIKTASRRT